MPKIAKIFSALVLVSIFSAVLQAQTSWLGRYEFSEDGGRNAGGTKIFISHELDIKQSENGLMATLQSNGYQTSKDLICTAKVSGDKLEVYFDSYGEDNLFESFEQGDLLLTLERKQVKGKAEILTNWNKVQPSLDLNAKSGKVYFKKIQ